MDKVDQSDDPAFELGVHARRSCMLLVSFRCVADGDGRAILPISTTAVEDASGRAADPMNPWRAIEYTHVDQRILRVRFHIIGNARIEDVGKSQSCMVSKLRIIWKQTVDSDTAGELAFQNS